MEQKNEEDASGRMGEEVALAEVHDDSATIESVPRKKAKTIKDYSED